MNRTTNVLLLAAMTLMTVSVVRRADASVAVYYDYEGVDSVVTVDGTKFLGNAYIRDTPISPPLAVSRNYVRTSSALGPKVGGVLNDSQGSGYGTASINSTLSPFLVRAAAAGEGGGELTVPSTIHEIIGEGSAIFDINFRYLGTGLPLPMAIDLTVDVGADLGSRAQLEFIESPDGNPVNGVKHVDFLADYETPETGRSIVLDKARFMLTTGNYYQVRAFMNGGTYANTLYPSLEVGHAHFTVNARVTAINASGQTFTLNAPLASTSDGTNRLWMDNAGLLNVTGNDEVLGRIDGGGDLTLATGAVLTVDGMKQDEVNLQALSTLRIRSGGDAATGLSVINSLDVAMTGPFFTATLDLTDHDLIIKSAGEAGLTQVAGLIASGRAGGTWLGTGLTSSTALLDGRELGYALAGAIGRGSHLGDTLAGDDVLVRYTQAGDANLDGIVNPLDLAIFDANYAPLVLGKTWATGDFDGNGVTNDLDRLALMVNYVPEPGAVGMLLVMAGVGLLRRKR